MRSALLLVLTALAALCGAPVVHAQVDVELAHRIERWFGYWKAGRIDLEAPLPKPGLTDRIYGAGVVPERTQRPLVHRDALERLLDRARAHQSAAVTRALLALAAVGLDGSPVDANRSPAAVRGSAGDVLAEFSAPTAIDALVEAAGPGERDVGVRVAALRALGAVRRPVVRVFVERHLDDPKRLVRLAAAEAVAARAHRDSLDDLTARIDVEDDPVVLQAVVIAVHRILLERGAEVDATAALQATLGSVNVLDRGGGDWRADLAIVELLMDARTARAIPVLIDVLARFDGRGERPKDSTILRSRAHAVLESLTGTRIRAEDVAGWREFWDRESAGFAVAPRVERRDDAGATTTGFFGIPIRGSRVVFVIDVSGSMKTDLAPFDNGTTSGRPSRAPASRLAWAKRELLAAVASLPSDARFSVVVFASGVDSWGKSMLPPNPEVRSALRGMLAELMAGGGTNLWGALDRALGVSDAAYGEIDAEGADEVFLLTDGQPSAGSVTSPAAIVAAVRDANRYRRVRIHAVSLGGDGAFLRELAEENGGTFVRR